MNRFKISPGILVTAGPASPPQNPQYTIYFDRLFLEALVGEAQKICCHLENGPLGPQLRACQGSWEPRSTLPSHHQSPGWIPPLPTDGTVSGYICWSKGSVCGCWPVQDSEGWLALPSAKGHARKPPPGRLWVPFQAEGLVLRLDHGRPPGQLSWRPWMGWKWGMIVQLRERSQTGLALVWVLISRG